MARTSGGRSAISAIPPALSVTGPYASSATMRPVIESCAITATPIPNRPARWFANRIPTAITITGSAVACIPIGEALDDVRRVAGLGRARDRLDRVPARAGVVLGDPDEERGDREPDQRRAVEIAEREVCRVESKPIVTGMKIERRDERRDEDRAVERVHDVAALADARELDADDRGDDRDAADAQRIEPELRCR